MQKNLQKAVRSSARRPEPTRETLEFGSLRNDWYSLNSVMPRAVRGTVNGRRPFCFAGFPRQWIPVFEWYGVPWKGTIGPAGWIPFISSRSESAVVKEVGFARRHGVLRSMVESISVFDSVIADFVYILDHSLDPDVAIARERDELQRGLAHRRRPLLLNSWQAYGRPAIRALADKAMSLPVSSKIAAVLPCALTRPYDRSKTHRKLYAILKSEGYPVQNLHRIVMTSLGILPEELWSEPEVAGYDAGVPDIYRTIGLARTYFRRHQYEVVLDCCQFPPYSDVLNIVAREGLIKRLVRVPVPKSRAFFVRA